MSRAPVRPVHRPSAAVWPAVALALALLASGVASAAPADALGSADALALGPDGVLFVADSRRGRIVALKPPATRPGPAGHFNLLGIDRTIAGQMGSTPAQVRLTDVVFDPAAGTAYVSVRRGFGDETVGAVFAARADGSVKPIDVAGAAPTEVLLGDPVPDDVALPRGKRMRDFTITDLDFHDGELFVAGMSGTAFDAVLRRVPYPFAGSAAVSKLQIFHASHAQNETRAPIRAQSIVALNGAWHAVAAYTCTPLVLFPLAGLKDGARVVGKTISELGYGNTPTDMLAFSAADQKGRSADFVLLLNRQRAPVLIPLSAVAEAAGKPGLTAGVGTGKGGVLGSEVPLVGVFAVADQGPERLLGLRRDAATGAVELVSVRKNIFFRLTDFVGEFDVPGYTAPPGTEQMAGFRKMLQTEEGFRP